ncbi:hypothetical protein [Novosphingobium gossypii]|uniref:hypothetical protein n=1 Tax=Novosphingobium gossypii TaxID=1604774 RepID=UPI003D2297DA
MPAPLTRLAPLALASILTLATISGCSSKSDAPQPTASATETEEVFQETPAPAEASLAADETEATPAGGLSEIPETIRGRWGLVAADCTSTKGDAKGLLEISADQLKFYESVAKLGEIKEAGESRIRGTFDYSGEGQSWTNDVVLDVQDDGKTMIRRDYGKDAMPGPLKYTRCT